MIESIPLPVTDNPVDAPFWEGTRRGELRVQHCGHCGEPRFPPLPRCAVCHSTRLGWHVVSGAGTVWSWVVPRPPLLPAFQQRAPYLVALVELLELPQIRMVGELVPAPGNTLRELLAAKPARALIGRRVQAGFRAVTADVSLLYWALPGQEGLDC